MTFSEFSVDNIYIITITLRFFHISQFKKVSELTHLKSETESERRSEKIRAKRDSL